jgi:hypothetical protein
MEYIGYKVLGSGFWVLGSRFCVLGSGFWVQRFWVLGSGFNSSGVLEYWSIGQIVPHN